MKCMMAIAFQFASKLLLFNSNQNRASYWKTDRREIVHITNRKLKYLKRY